MAATFRCPCGWAPEPSAKRPHMALSNHQNPRRPGSHKSPWIEGGGDFGPAPPPAAPPIIAGVINKWV
eukprot:gene10801-biopygen8980